MKVGNIRPQDDFLADTWQRVYSHTVAVQEGLDTYDKLLIHFNGTDGSTNDYTAETGQTVSLEGTAQLDTAQKNLGSASLLCDGNSDYATVPDNDNWNFGTGDFQIDFKVRFASVAGSSGLFSQYVDGNNFIICQYIQSENKLLFWVRSGGTNIAYTGISTVNFSADTWYHIAIYRYGNNLYLALDGDIKTTVDVTGKTFPDLAANFAIGFSTGYEGDKYLNGWIDEFHIRKGSTYWTAADFTVPTTEYGLTSLTISGLDGNTEEEYILRCRFVNGYNGAANYYARLNADSATNYGFQRIYGSNTSIGASRTTNDTGFELTNCAALSKVAFTDMTIYTKSGFVRTAISKNIDDTATTAIVSIHLFGQSWNNTVDNITSLVILSDQTAGLGVGSVIELYAKKSKV